MALSSGTRLGVYEIVAPIGAGGMGEVYRARDTKLGREVALKVLPQELAADAERMGRFEREAKVLASLNHPNVASIYGFEDSGDVHALVMELVEGPTLAETIAGMVAGRKPASGSRRSVSGAAGAGQSAQAEMPALPRAIPLDEALAIAKQIADGLEYAHERGIVHRDLKPANVKITPDSVVKILDFGLAKALEGDPASVDISTSPTISRMATQAGIILGTAAYMSPEQAKGKTVDRRADIWAFGCVLYEMLTGKMAFRGETITDTLAEVIKSEPDWNALPANTPQAIRILLQRCLKKDPKQRLQAIGDARIALEENASGAAQELASPAAIGASKIEAQAWRRGGLLWAALAVLLALGLAFAFKLLSRKTGSQPSPVHLSIEMPAAHALLNTGADVAISPDGRQIAFVASNSGGSPQIWLRNLDDFNARLVSGTEGGEAPFFSPDGQWLGFFAGEKLKKVPVSGGVAQPLCSAGGGDSGSWAPDGTIYFAGGIGSLMSVSSSGGQCQSVVGPEASHGAVGFTEPSILPDGESLLVSVDNGFSGEETNVAVLSLKTHQLKPLVQAATNPAYLPPGYLVFARSGSLWAARFDAVKLELTSAPVPVISGVANNSGDVVSQFAVSGNGMLVYAPGSEVQPRREVVELDRAGTAKVVFPSAAAYEDLCLSPDGAHLAMTIEGEPWNIWTLDLGKKTLARLTFRDDNRDPIWSADGKEVAYTSLRNGQWGVFEKPGDGSGQEHSLYQSDVWTFATSFSPDNRTMAIVDDNAGTGADIFFLPLSPPGKARPFLQTQAAEWFAQFSPDGKWVAYESNETGRWEVYVQSSGASGGKWQISNGGGQRPLWLRNDSEIVYQNGNAIMAVPVQTKPTFSPGSPVTLFHYDYFPSGRDFDVSADGKHLFFIKSLSEAASPTELRVILDWTGELAKLTGSTRLQ